MPRGQWWQNRLFNAGFRLTNPRALVMSILRQTNEHLSAEDIYRKALGMDPSVGLTTVYRTLDLFYQIGVVQKFDIGDGKTRYELTNNPLKKDHHHHLICQRCKSIIDYTDFMNEELEFMKKTENALSARYQFDISHHIIHFYGICSQCRNLPPLTTTGP